MIGVYLTPQPSGTSYLSVTMSSNSSALNLIKAHFFEVVMELGFSSTKNLNHMLLILQLSEDGHDDLANENPGH